VKTRIEYNRHFLLELFKNITGKKKTVDSLSRFIADPVLIKTFCLIEELFPLFELAADEITVEHNRLIVRARIIGQTQIFNTRIGIPFVLGCQVQGGKIINHWFLIDDLTLMQQIEQFKIQ
jgi:hypothetical protein